MKIFRFIGIFFRFIGKIFKSIYSFIKFIVVILALITLLAIIFGFSFVSSEINDYVSKSTKSGYLSVDMGEDKIVVLENLNINSHIRNYDDENESISFVELSKKLSQIKRDSKVKAMYINLDNFNIKLSEAIELQKMMKEIADQKKQKDENFKIYAYATDIDKYKYFNSLISDSLYMSPNSASSFSLAGNYYNKIYPKKLLDKIGIEFLSIHTGDDKTYQEELVRDSMSNEMKKQVLLQLKNFDDIFDEQFLKIKGQDFYNKYRNDIKNGTVLLLTSRRAKEKMYVDLIQENELKKKLEKTYDAKYIDIKTYKLNENIKKDKIFVLTLKGSIENEYGYLYKEKVQRKLEEAKKTHPKGLIIVLDSPGGSAFEAEEIYNEIVKFKEKQNIPIYFLSSNVLASGGYYIALSGDKIFAKQGSLVGSIGVTTKIPVFDKVYENMYLKNEKVYYEPNMDITKKDAETDSYKVEQYKQFIQDIYLSFKEKVSKSRNMSLDEVEKLAGGKIYNAYQAKDLNLVDDVLTLKETIDVMAKDLGIKRYSIIENENVYLNILDKLKYKIIKKLVSVEKIKIEYK